MTPPRWEYGRKTAEGVPIWYVTIDESGHPYYDGNDTRPFTMGAILSGDPLDAVKTLQVFPGENKSGKYREATGELKHIRSSSSLDSKIMEQLEKQGFALFAVSVPYKKNTDQSYDVGSVFYLGTLSRLLIKIADSGPDGIYRIRIDESEYLDEALAYKCAEAAFSSVPGKTLAEHSPVRFYDSAFDPAIQVADSFVGQYRKAVSDGEGDGFAKRYGITLANKKKKNGDPVLAVSSLSKTGRQDSCAMGIRVGDSTSLLSPYSDDTRVLHTHQHVPYKYIRPRTGRNPEKSGFYGRFRGQDKAKTTAKTTRRSRK